MKPAKKDRNAQIAMLFVVTGTLCVVLAAFLPWGRSGRNDRTSFELVGVAETFEILDGAAATAAAAWYLVPAAGAAVVLAAVTGRRRLAIAVAVPVATVGAAFALAVRSSLLIPRSGTSATIVGAVLVAAGVGIGIAAGRTKRS